MNNKKIVNFNSSKENFSETIGMSENTRKYSCTVLLSILNDLIVLGLHLKSAHWNIKCSNFYARHLLFEKLYSENEQIIDKTGELIVSLNHSSHIDILNLEKSRININPILDKDSGVYINKISSLIFNLIKLIKNDIELLDDGIIINYLQDIILKLQHFTYLLQPND